MAAEAIHLSEDLVKGLFALVMASAETCTAGTADAIQLVDKDNRR